MPTIVRIVAIFLLLLTGVELVACELASPEACELTGGQGSGGADCSDACLCCCIHIVVTSPIAFDPSEVAVYFEPLPPVPFASLESAAVYHPPRA